MCVYIGTYIQEFTHIYKYTNVHVDIYIERVMPWQCLPFRFALSPHVPAYTCIELCDYICVYIFVRIYKYLHLYINTQIYM